MASTTRSFTFRAYPNRQQGEALELHLAEAARLHNAAVQERRDAWRLGRHRVTFYTQDAQLKDIRAAGDIGIIDATAARNVLRRVDEAFRGFFRRVKAGEKPGYPRFKSAKRYDTLAYRVGNGAKVLPRAVRLHGIGIVRVKFHRPVDGRAKQIVIRREAGRWFVIVHADCEHASLPPSDAAVGVDVGLTAFATLSDGTEIENPRHERAAASQIRRARRALARKMRGSNRRQRAAVRLRLTLGKVRRQRADFQHKVSRSLVNAHGLIAVEDLNVKGLARTRLARSVSDAGWSSFLNKLTYKAANAGRTLVRVDPRGTSQTCPCGQAVPKTMKERRHDCPACGLSIGRDHAAALVILQRGLRCQALSVATAALA